MALISHDGFQNLVLILICKSVFSWLDSNLPDRHDERTIKGSREMACRNSRFSPIDHYARPYFFSQTAMREPILAGSTEPILAVGRAM